MMLIELVQVALALVALVFAVVILRDGYSDWATVRRLGLNGYKEQLTRERIVLSLVVMGLLGIILASSLLVWLVNYPAYPVWWGVRGILTSVLLLAAMLYQRYVRLKLYELWERERNGRVVSESSTDPPSADT